LYQLSTSSLTLVHIKPFSLVRRFTSNIWIVGVIIAMIMMLSGSCKIGQIGKDFKVIKKDAAQISKDIKSVRHSFTPIDSAMMAATSGLLNELADTNSQVKLDTISARINRILVRYLNESFQNLETGPAGRKLARGAMEPILDTATEIRLQAMIHSVSQKAADDLTGAVRGMLNELSSTQSKAKLNSLLLSLFTNHNSDSLSAFINRSVGKVNFDFIGHSIAAEIIEANVKPQVDSVMRMAVRSIFDEIRKDKNAKGFFSDVRNILLLGLGLIGMLMAVFFWLNQRKNIEMNRMFVHAIEDLEGVSSEDAKRAIEKQARDRGLLRKVDKILEKENVFDKKDPPA
ncbi:MAG TPA: hypothetical protein VJ508_19915, partial [Saprospiraceae bacterium]|nr:hypothetical protein [Saprospiraceae bacterium]